MRQRPVEEDVRALVAAAAVLAGILLALVHVHLTVVSTVTCREERLKSFFPDRPSCDWCKLGVEASLTGPTPAAVLADPLHARRSVLTRVGGAFGNVFLAVVPDEARVLAVTPVAAANTNRNVSRVTEFYTSSSPAKEIPFQRTQTPGCLPFAPLPLLPQLLAAFILSSSISDSC